ncbi:MAG: helix-turn-helix domain-containing protein, partial [Cyclobacteriaceae bacterium]
NGDLTAAQLAAMMGISRHQLSDVLNTELNIKFYDFINQYRVTTFKEKLSDPSNQRITLLGLALDSGFNSKASFNSTFKRLTGLTPKQFRDNLRNST